MADIDGNTLGAVAAVVGTAITAEVSIPVVVVAGVGAAIAYGAYKLFTNESELQANREEIQEKDKLLKDKDEEIKLLQQKYREIEYRCDDLQRKCKKLEEICKTAKIRDDESRKFASDLLEDNKKLSEDNKKLLEDNEKLEAQIDELEEECKRRHFEVPQHLKTMRDQLLYNRHIIKKYAS